MTMHPVEYRHRVLALTDDGLSAPEIAAALGVSGAWVTSIKRRHAAGQSLALGKGRRLPASNHSPRWPVSQPLLARRAMTAGAGRD